MSCVFFEVCLPLGRTHWPEKHEIRAVRCWEREVCRLCFITWHQLTTSIQKDRRGQEHIFMWTVSCTDMHIQYAQTDLRVWIPEIKPHANMEQQMYSLSSCIVFRYSQNHQNGTCWLEVFKDMSLVTKHHQTIKLAGQTVRLDSILLVFVPFSLVWISFTGHTHTLLKGERPLVCQTWLVHW